MSWLMSGGELLAGGVALVLWWLALIGRRNAALSNFRLVFLPAIFLLWAVGGIIVILHGLSLL